MDALTLLKEDHDAVKELLTKLDGTTERGIKTREELFTRLRRDLEAHETIEEEILYPALKEHPKAKELVLEAYEEHHVVDLVMEELDGVPYDDEAGGRSSPSSRRTSSTTSKRRRGRCSGRLVRSSTRTSWKSSGRGCRLGSESWPSRW
jgi:hypothetical protein